MTAGSITLADVAAKTPTLGIVCSRRERAGRYRLDTLIAQHDADFGIPALLDLLSADCPKLGVCGKRVIPVTTVISSANRATDIFWQISAVRLPIRSRYAAYAEGCFVSSSRYRGNVFAVWRYATFDPERVFYKRRHNYDGHHVLTTVKPSKL